MTEFLEAAIDKFVFRVAADRRYSLDGVWVLETATLGQALLGVSDYVQQRSGDAAFVHLKPIGTRLARGGELAEIETIKATLSVVMPLAGEIVAVNKDLDLNPENVNQEPYGKGWLAVVQVANWDEDRGKLLTPQAYMSAIETQARAEMESS